MSSTGFSKSMEMSSTDAERGEVISPRKHLEGYAEFADFISSDPQLSVYRKYDRLAARNLLYLEANVQWVEIELERLDEEDMKILDTSQNEVEKKRVEESARCWEALVIQAKKKEERAIRRMELIMKLRSAMKEYEEALLRRKEICALASPDHNCAAAFSNWFFDREPLTGSGHYLLDDESDVCTLYTGGDSDRLSSLIQRYTGWYVRSRKEVPQGWNKSLYYYPASRIAWIVAILSVFISSMLLIGAIVVLYLVKDMSKRLGIVAAFTGGFAASLGLLTNARRAEIFGATAAYAAVLVVFVGVDN